jgi:hypothetical protein
VEARFYTFCQDDPRGEPMRRLVPHLFEFHAEEATVVLELLRSAIPFRQLYAAIGAGDEPGDVGDRVGAALGTFHRTCRVDALGEVPTLGRLVDWPPWILAVHKPGPEMLGRLSPANMVTVRILQQDEQLSRALDTLRQGWRRETLIHGDIKADNLLLVHEEGEAPAGQAPGQAPAVRGLGVRLVDWELLQVGDPAWDLGGMLHDMLLWWVQSMPASSARSADERLQEAQLPLPRVKQLMRGVWSGYRKAAGLRGDDAAELLRRSVGYTAARIIQSAYETSNNAPSLSNHAVVMLQLCANILADPAAASLDLFGLPPAWILKPS